MSKPYHNFPEGYVLKNPYVSLSINILLLNYKLLQIQQFKKPNINLLSHQFYGLHPKILQVHIQGFRRGWDAM